MVHHRKPWGGFPEGALGLVQSECLHLCIRETTSRFFEPETRLLNTMRLITVTRIIVISMLIRSALVTEELGRKRALYFMHSLSDAYYLNDFFDSE